MTDFSTQQVKMFRKMFADSPMTSGLEMPETFLLQFVLFEALARLALSKKSKD
jgi:hypothetical protein